MGKERGYGTGHSRPHLPAACGKRSQRDTFVLFSYSGLVFYFFVFLLLLFVILLSLSCAKRPILLSMLLSSSKLGRARRWHVKTLKSLTGSAPGRQCVAMPLPAATQSTARRAHGDLKRQFAKFPRVFIFIFISLL